MAWREDFRRVPNGGEFVMIVDAAMSRQWEGFREASPEVVAQRTPETRRRGSGFGRP